MFPHPLLSRAHEEGAGVLADHFRVALLPQPKPLCELAGTRNRGVCSRATSGNAPMRPETVLVVCGTKIARAHLNIRGWKVTLNG